MIFRSLLVISILLAVLGLAAGEILVEGHSPTALEWLWWVFHALLLTLAGLVVWQRPGDWTASVFLAFAGVNLLAAAGLARIDRLDQGFWQIPLGLSLVFWPAVACHWMLLFPRPTRFFRQHAAGVLGVVYLLPVVAAAGLAGGWASRWTAAPAGVTSSGGDGSAWHWLVAAGVGGSLMALAGASTGALSAWWKSRTRPQRSQSRWLIAALALGGLPVALAATRVFSSPGWPVDALSAAGLEVGSLLLTLLGAVGLTRHRVVWVGRILDRSLFYMAISFVVTALYCLMVGVMTAWVGTYLLRWENALAAGMTAMLVVSFLGWIRDRFQQALDRRFRRQKYQLDTAIRRLSRVVDRLVEPRQLARQLLSSARDAVGVERGAVFLRDKGGDLLSQAAVLGPWAFPEQISLESSLAGELRLSAVVTARPGLAVLPSAGQQQLRELESELALALEFDGVLMGLVVLGPHGGGVPYTPEDRNFLVALARTTVLALHSARGHRTIETLKEKLRETVDKLAEQQQRISYLQGELLRRRDPAGPTASGAGGASGARAAGSPAASEPELRGSSPALAHLLSQARRVAASPSSVLIRGESGTGKELLAQFIHKQSPRAAAPFVAVHCAALSPGLLESELFGHVRGAFTGADRDKPGRFELAHGGTLFLDEIGDVSLEVQTKLLRVLQKRSFERVGGVKPIEVDVRLIAATHQNLEALIRAGQFREDLYYRLNVISLVVPPLRERREDVFELAVHFLRRYAERAGKPLERIEPEALDRLAEYAWPGNVRQLENAIERAVVLAEGASLRLVDLPPELAETSGSGLGGRSSRRRLPTGPRPQRRADGRRPTEPLAESPGDSAELLEALAQCQGNKAEAARLLGVPRSTFFSRLRRAGIP